ncbi:MAG: hypothetical protein DRI87_09900 [Bacteroidetes bacterium]|nr:MAG: hypothetical protein DRI87_09900 [Bacteroidota bacterium]
MSKLSEKIKRLLRLYSRVERIGLYNQEQMAYQQLQRLSFVHSFLPVTVMSMSFTAILHILNEIVIHEKKNIIEFGSGISTIYIARLLKEMNWDCRFYSVDTNKEWIAKMKQILEKESLQDKVVFIEAGITDVPDPLKFKDQTKWYDTNLLNKALKSTGDYDLVIVDGPNGWTCPYARNSAVPFLKEKMTDNVTVFLDDTRRSNEMEIIKNWQSLLNLEVEHYSRYSIMYKPGMYTAEPFYYGLRPIYF